MDYTSEENANRIHWNDVAPAHYTHYDLATLRNGGSALEEIEKRELGDIEGKRIVHMQCHIGSDTLSLERGGAAVTGVDFSEDSIVYAKKLRDELGLKTEFVVGNVLQLPELVEGQFDIVYTGQGALTWIRDIEIWGRNIAQVLKPGGCFYIYEYHPFAYVFDDEHESLLTPKYSYFNENPLLFANQNGDYASPDYVSSNPTYEWTWTVGQIQNVLIHNGLRILFFHEHQEATYKMFPFLDSAGGNRWRLPDSYPRIPLMYSMKAVKDQS